MKRKARALAAAFAAGALFLTGCSSSGGGSSSTDSSGLTKITVGVLPIIDVAPIYVGLQQGFFKEQGLDVTVKTAPTGDVLVPSVLSGQYQFGFSNLTSLFQGVDNGLPIKLVAPGDFSSGQDGKDISGLIVAPGSTITGANSTMNGKKVTVSAVKNIAEPTIKETVEKGGGDPNSLQLVQMDFPNVASAVLNHQVDVGFVLEPFLSQALAKGAKLVASPFVHSGDPFLVASYFTSANELSNDPATVEKFDKAISESLDYAQAHPDATRASFGQYMDLDSDTQQKMWLPKFSSKWTPEEVQEHADLALKWGVIPKKIDASSLLQ